MPSIPQRRPKTEPRVADEILAPESSVLDLLDRLLNKGVMLNGDVTLGIAGVDLIYLRLASIFSAVDRVLPTSPPVPPRGRSSAHRRLRRRT